MKWMPRDAPVESGEGARGVTVRTTHEGTLDTHEAEEIGSEG